MLLLLKMKDVLSKNNLISLDEMDNENIDGNQV